MSPWEEFYREEMLALLKPGSLVVDIGGGLRATKARGNRYDPRQAYLEESLEKVTYQILDPVPDYSPDIVGDIHALPLKDNSVDAVVCIAVLEHVEDPKKAMSEMYRVLKPGGKLFLYVPFLYYYHAEVGYYKDYWRFTKDALELLAAAFTTARWSPVRGALETWIHISPLGRIWGVPILARYVDVVTKKTKSKQVSGYYGLLIK
jgi:ubiquinone/menaquinone biosynthesis C-methylase UbiE